MSIALLAARPRHRPGGWSPKELSTDLALWFDADDATTVTVSTGVSQWDDKSGNGINLTQSTGSNQPTWTKNSINGRAVLDFNGSAHRLVTSAKYEMFATNTTPNAVFLVVNFDNVSSQRCYFGWAPDNGGLSANAKSMELHTGLVNRSGALSVHRGFDYATKTANSTVATSTSYILSLHVLSTGNAPNNINIYRNGTSQTVTNNTTGWLNAGSYPTGALVELSVGARYDQGTTWDNYMDGRIGELLVVRADVTQGNREKIEGYLAAKWGLTGSLSAGHPYKSIAP